MSLLFQMFSLNNDKYLIVLSTSSAFDGLISAFDRLITNSADCETNLSALNGTLETLQSLIRQEKTICHDLQ